jgi:hypothetical protein
LVFFWYLLMNLYEQLFAFGFVSIHLQKFICFCKKKSKQLIFYFDSFLDSLLKFANLLEFDRI